MKRLSMIFLSVLLTAVSAFSRPAHQGTTRVQQPDGSYVTIRLVGDEYRSFNTTSDGYTLTRNDQGYYVYARLDADGRLAPTELVARDAEERTMADEAYLQSVGRMLTPKMEAWQEQERQLNKTARAKVLAQRRAGTLYDYNKFRGLIILVEYNDCPFRYTDYNDIMEKMVNQDDYTGENRTNIPSYNIKCTGSMRDYFRDNSSGIFLPTFDIVGPVKINRSQYYPRPNGTHENTNYTQLMTDAINAADGLVNFKDYDVDNDGTVDMVYFIFSGLPSYIAGNDAHLLWPHQADLRWYKNLRKDNVYIGRYACSTELFGNDSWNVLEGIGTMTHEFSHVLGLPDFYDTNNTNEEQCVDPGLWSVMANGADGNYGRTPINYSLFERYALGFATPEVISEPGTFSIGAIHESNAGFRLNTPVKKEFFLLENRQKVKWDSVLPGHGMLIFRVDSTNSYVWTYSNSVNDNPNHPYYELVRAKGVQTTDSPRDPFPGTGRVTAISNETSPANLLTWAGKPNDFGLRNISEKDGVISFEAYYVNVLTDVIIPDSVVMAFGTTMQITPTLIPENAIATLTWASDNESVVTVDDTGLVTAVNVGEANIIVSAGDGISDTCHVTVNEQPSVPDIAAFRAMNDGDMAVLTLTNVQVLFVNGDNIYIRDASGSLMLSGTGLQVNKNDIINGKLLGRLDIVNRMPQLTAVENSTSIADIEVTKGGTEVQPLDVKHNGTLTDNMLDDLLSLRAVILTLDNKQVFAEVGDQRAKMYNTFKLKNISAPKSSALTGKYFDVTGILTTEVVGDTLTYVISITESVVEVEKPVDDIVVTGVILPDSVVMEYGSTLQLTATLVPEEAVATLTWTSDNETVVTVDANGLVTAIDEGEANIIVSAGDGVSDTCHVTVNEQPSVPDIAAFRAMDEGSRTLLKLTGAQVLFVNGDSIYIRDASGSLMLSGTGLQVSKNDTINGKLFGQLDIVNRMPQLTAVEGSTSIAGIEVIAGETEAQPLDVNYDGTLTDNLLDDLVALRAVVLTPDNDMVFAEVGDQRARMYNTFKLEDITVPNDSTLAGKYYDLIGILTTEVMNDTLTYVVSLTEPVVEVKRPSDVIIGDVNGDGVVDVADISSIISYMAGEEKYEAEEGKPNPADVNGDGIVDVADISSVISIMAGEYK